MANLLSVSIPYRYATNAVASSAKTEGIRVSIPYRYATNHRKVILARRSEMFQFLIGTLQTRPGRYCRSFSDQFQFLIGTLQTLLAHPKPASRNAVSIPYRYATNRWQIDDSGAIMRFQFLIGTLQTPAGGDGGVLGVYVSIPYRYATNVIICPIRSDA